MFNKIARVVNTLFLLNHVIYKLGLSLVTLSAERQIKNYLFDPHNFYDKNSRPSYDFNQTNQTKIVVKIGISLFHILDTNEKSQTISTLLAIRLRWADPHLTWDPEKFDNFSKIWVPGHLIWKPDIVINNNADDQFDHGLRTNAIIESDGKVLWMYPAVVKTYCTLNVRHFPFDSQSCDIIFISWTYSGDEIDLEKEDGEIGIHYREENQEWKVTHITHRKNEKYYACCTSPFPDITFSLHISRRSTFYVFNLIFPCLLMYAICFTGFLLPVESNDKVNLEITILLAMIVFLMVIVDLLPPTPDAIPLLGLFFGVTMIMVSISVCMAVIVTNVYYRSESPTEIPPFIRFLFLADIYPNEDSNLSANPFKQYWRKFLSKIFHKPVHYHLHNRYSGDEKRNRTKSVVCARGSTYCQRKSFRKGSVLTSTKDPLDSRKSNEINENSIVELKKPCDFKLKEDSFAFQIYNHRGRNGNFIGNPQNQLGRYQRQERDSNYCVCPHPEVIWKPRNEIYKTEVDISPLFSNRKLQTSIEYSEIDLTNHKTPLLNGNRHSHMNNINHFKMNEELPSDKKNVNEKSRDEVESETGCDDKEKYKYFSSKQAKAFIIEAKDEWRILARRLDSVFLMIFIVASICEITWLANQIPENICH